LYQKRCRVGRSERISGWRYIKIVLKGMPSTVAVPEIRTAIKETEHEEHGRLYHVVLLDDDEHTYDYVIEMLQKLFFMSKDIALRHALEVDSTGRTVVITCEKSEADFGRDQIHAFGADPRMPKSKGSMTAVVVPAGNTKTA
jgi:ATP-dependent Clp protease adaptor protein ClpS